MDRFCINRHERGVNGPFMDWAARKVGLRELWTFTWCWGCNTAGPWMQEFKDY